MITSDEETAEAPAESSTLSVNVKTPLAVGVPVIETESPVLELRDRPGGKAPDARDQLKGDTPPDSATVALYAALTLPEGNEVVVIAGGGSTVIFNEALRVGYVTEVTVTVTVTGALRLLGALYVAAVVVTVLREPAPVAGLRLHVTPALDESLDTVALISRLVP